MSALNHYTLALNNRLSVCAKWIDPILLLFLLILSPYSLESADHWNRILPSRDEQEVLMNDTSQPMPTLAIRLIFEYEGQQVRLVSQQPVDIAITGFDITRAQHPSYYIDTRAADGWTLARVPARDAMSGSAEVFPERSDEPITRIDGARLRGAFTVVVPVPEGADHVAVVHVAPATPEALLPSSRATSAVPGSPEVTELASFPLQISR
jgi:hypothetical protein